ncbi:hypothetical protein BDL97_07G016500 [Sphagnum fallax]|nr:hypothetical protein BDL97_07G016500 [Sphagnum fallax]
MGCGIGFLQNPRTLNPNNQEDEEEEEELAAMADARSIDLDSLLHPFHERALLAEERIAKLEASVQGGGVAGVVGQEELLVSLVELRGKLLKVKAEHEAEKEKLVSENKKLQYQVLHLKRAVQEADNKIGIKTVSG